MRHAPAEPSAGVAHNNASSEEDAPSEYCESFHDASEASTDEWQDVTEHLDPSALPGPSQESVAPLTGAHVDAAAAASAPADEKCQTTTDGSPAYSEALPADTGQVDLAAQTEEGSQSPVRLRPPDAFWDNARSRPLSSTEPGPEATDDVAAAESMSAHAESSHEAHAVTVAEEPDILTADEAEKRTSEANALKLEGNRLFASQDWQQAQVQYSAALQMAPAASSQRAVYFANRAACALKLQQWSDAMKDCSAAVAIDPNYTKAYLRRATAYEESDDLDRSLADYDKVFELDSSHISAKAKAAKLRPVVEERREKMKEEMMGKLKELGNTVLGKFGMSVDNFKAVKGPDGGYSLSFQQ